MLSIIYEKMPACKECATHVISSHKSRKIAKHTTDTYESHLVYTYLPNNHTQNHSLHEFKSFRNNKTLTFTFLILL